MGLSVPLAAIAVGGIIIIVPFLSGPKIHLSFLNIKEKLYQ